MGVRRTSERDVNDKQIRLSRRGGSFEVSASLYGTCMVISIDRVLRRNEKGPG